MDRIKNWLSDLDWDFVGKRRAFGAISAVLVLLSWVAFFAIGPNWGIDFTGGVEMHIKFCEDVEADVCVAPTTNPVTIDQVRPALVSLGLSEDVIQRVKLPEDQEYIIRIQDPTFGSESLQAEVKDRLAKAYGDDWWQDVRVDAEVGARMTIVYDGPYVSGDEAFAKLCPSGDCAQDGLEGVTTADGKEENEVVVKLPSLGDVIQKSLREALGEAEFATLAVDAVGPKVGGDLRRQGFTSIAITLGLVLIYVAFRFDIGFAPGAVVALFHDVTLVMGVLVVMGAEINLPIVGALLTIVGYSLNDTIVIYDRIRENQEKYRRKETADLINVSVNETMARTLATSVTTFLAVMPFVLFTTGIIQGFAFAMLLGIVFGTYSTVYVASPMILIMEDVKPYLMGMLKVPGIGGDDDGDDDEDGPKELSESEKRRRERATKQAQRQG